MSKKRIAVNNNYYDQETGAYIGGDYVVRFVEYENNYSKIYFPNLFLVSDIGDALFKTFIFMIYCMDFNNEIHITARNSAKLCHWLNIGEETLRKQIVELCKTNAIYLIEPHHYFINPAIVSKQALAGRKKLMSLVINGDGTPKKDINKHEIRDKLKVLAKEYEEKVKKKMIEKQLNK